MTAKEFVKQKYPNAECMSIEGASYMVWKDDNPMGAPDDFLASGTSESNAWVNAKKRIIEQEEPVNNQP